MMNESSSERDETGENQPLPCNTCGDLTEQRSYGEPYCSATCLNNHETAQSVQDILSRPLLGLQTHVALIVLIATAGAFATIGLGIYEASWVGVALGVATLLLNTLTVFKPIARGWINGA